MASLTFDTCCGCIELRTGCLIIGYLNLVLNVLLMSVGIVDILVAMAIAVEYDADYHGPGGFTIAVIGITLIVTMLLIGSIIALLVGIYKSKRGHVKSYLISSVIGIIIYVLSFLVSFVDSGYPTDLLVIQLLNIILSIYFLLVIRSYYYKMDTSATSYNTLP